MSTFPMSKFLTKSAALHQTCPFTEYSEVSMEHLRRVGIPFGIACPSVHLDLSHYGVSYVFPVETKAFSRSCCNFLLFILGTSVGSFSIIRCAKEILQYRVTRILNMFIDISLALTLLENSGSFVMINCQQE